MFYLVDVSCKGCGKSFEEGDCVLVQTQAEYHYIPRDTCSEEIFFDCFQRTLGSYNGNDKIGVYNRGRIHVLPESFFELDRSGAEVRARLIG